MLFAARGAVGRGGSRDGAPGQPREARPGGSGGIGGLSSTLWSKIEVKDGPDGSGAGQGTVGGGTRPQPALLLLTPNNQGRTSMITLFSNPMALAVRHEFWLLSKPGVRCG